MISIIISTYNSDPYFEETLRSIIKQNNESWECIIVDDGSTDKTINISKNFCKKDSRFRHFKRPSNLPKGANACRNFGYEKSTGEYVQWFDADDLMHPDMLKQKVEKLRDSDANFVVCEGLIFQGSQENITGKWGKLESAFPLLDHALGNINFQTNAPIFKRNFLQGKKLWNEKLQRKQDYEFFSRLLSYNPSYEIIKNPLFYYRVHANSVNGKNEEKSLSSMIKADSLVFNNVKPEAIRQGMFQKVQKHFLRKNVSRLEMALAHKNWKACFLVLTNLIKIMDLRYIKNHFLASY